MARDWSDLIKDDTNNFQEFKQNFLKRFWNENTQFDIKKKIEFDIYQPHLKTSRVHYAISRINNAKDLEMENLEIIKKLARHFSEDVRMATISRGTKTIDEFLELLEAFDTIAIGNQNYIINQNPYSRRINTTNNDSEYGQRRQLENQRRNYYQQPKYNQNRNYQGQDLQNSMIAQPNHQNENNYFQNQNLSRNQAYNQNKTNIQGKQQIPTTTWQNQKRPMRQINSIKMETTTLNPTTDEFEMPANQGNAFASCQEI